MLIADEMNESHSRPSCSQREMKSVPLSIPQTKEIGRKLNSLVFGD